MTDSNTVYVVDDDEASAMSVSALLCSVGIEVVTFSSAEEFLERFQPEAKACLVLDVRLQGMDGLDLQSRLAAENVKIPIIIISGHADREISRRALENGAVACFEKPFDGRDLCRVVQEALQQ